MTGECISHYKILEKLGEGGMGEVYLAEDTKLKRHVTLKFLHKELTREEDAKKRFIQEARAAARLDHTNICSVFEIDETEDGQLFIAMAFYEGETLRDKFKKGLLKIKEALDITVQISRGLNKAHENGIVHRDIKPANILITKDNIVKILDFGLAKLKGQTKLTKDGTTLGTVAYMSPEQAQGKKVDHRTDIWSLGVILYEMISGQLPFKGEYEQAILYSILNEEQQPLTACRTDVPVNLEEMVNKCLAKDPDLRYQHIDDIIADLKRLSQDSGKSAPVKPVPRINPFKTIRLRPAIPWILVALLGFLLVWLIFFTPKEKTKPETYRFSINFPRDQRPALDDTLWFSFAVSPDGKWLAYLSFTKTGYKVMLRDLNDYSIRQLLVHKRPANIFFSADGSWLGFYDPTDLLLKKISLPDGVPELICEHKIPWPMGIAWTQTDEIFYGSISDGLYKIPADRGSPVRITQLNRESGERTHRWPSPLPDNQGLLFTIGDVDIKSYDEAKIAIYDFSTKSIKILDGRGSHPLYIPGGYICYSRDSKIITSHFDRKKKEIVGTPIMVLDGIITSEVFGFPFYNFTRQGMLIYWPGNETAYHNKLISINRKGTIEDLSLPENYYRALSLSPDGKKIALHIGGANDHIWIWDRKRKTSSPLTLTNNNLVPIWMPDNLHITFQTTRFNGGVITRNIKTKKDARLFNFSSVNQIPSSWDRTGHYLLVTTNTSGKNNDIFIYSLSENKVHPFRNSKFDETKPMFSPDSHWIAYSSDETGNDEVYISSFPDTKTTTRVSVGGGTVPVWNPNGKELFYRNGKQFLSIEINTTANRVKIGKQKVLFEIETKHIPLSRSYDYDAINDRFIFISKQNKRELPEMRVIVNWIDEVKNKLEAKAEKK